MSAVQANNLILITLPYNLPAGSIGLKDHLNTTQTCPKYIERAVDHWTVHPHCEVKYTVRDEGHNPQSSFCLKKCISRLSRCSNQSPVV